MVYLLLQQLGAKYKGILCLKCFLKYLNISQRARSTQVYFYCTAVQIFEFGNESKAQFI